MVREDRTRRPEHADGDHRQQSRQRQHHRLQVAARGVSGSHVSEPAAGRRAEHPEHPVLDRAHPWHGRAHRRHRIELRARERHDHQRAAGYVDFRAGVLSDHHAGRDARLHAGRIVHARQPGQCRYGERISDSARRYRSRGHPVGDGGHRRRGHRRGCQRQGHANRPGTARGIHQRPGPAKHRQQPGGRIRGLRVAANGNSRA